MDEENRTPFIIDTVLINGLYEAERRSGEDRRKNRMRWKGYERRLNARCRRKRIVNIKV